jgi:hypothetical protein
VKEVADSSFDFDSRGICVVENGFVTFCTMRFSKRLACIVRKFGRNQTPSHNTFRVEERLDHECHGGYYHRNHQISGGGIQLPCPGCLNDMP